MRRNLLLGVVMLVGAVGITALADDCPNYSLRTYINLMVKIYIMLKCQ
jgi:hypothetical protein